MRRHDKLTPLPSHGTTPLATPLNSLQAGFELPVRLAFGEDPFSRTSKPVVRHLFFAPGLYARLRLVSGTASDAVLVPERSIGTDQSKKFVMVVGTDDVVMYRGVQLGELYDGMRVVTSGLAPGERIVVDGLQRVRPGSKVAPEIERLDERGQVVAGGEPATATASSNTKR